MGNIRSIELGSLDDKKRFIYKPWERVTGSGRDVYNMLHVTDLSGVL